MMHLARQVGDVGHAVERQQVVHAQRLERDVAHEDELVVALVGKQRSRSNSAGVSSSANEAATRRGVSSRSGESSVGADRAQQVERGLAPRRRGRASRVDDPRPARRGAVAPVADFLVHRASVTRGIARGGRGAQARGELDQHAHAVAGRAAAERVAAILVEQRRAEHVDVGPRPVAGELRQERRGDDRKAEALARGVAQVGDRRVDQRPIAPVKRPRPGEVAAGVAGLHDGVAPRLVGREHAGVQVAHAGAHRAGQRGQIDDVRRAVSACVPQRVGEDQASLGVGVVHLDGEAGGGRDHVGGPDRGAAQHVLAGGHDPGHRQREPELGDRAERCDDRGAAGHVRLLADDVGLRLEEVTAGIEGDGLADQRQPRCLRGIRRRVPEDDQARGIGLLPPTAASAPRPDLTTGVDNFTAQVGKLPCPIG